MANGYLRQVEFRRWAASVDDALGQLNAKVTTHGEILAVVKDRQRLGETDKHDSKSLRYSIIAAGVATLFSALVHLFIHGGVR